MHKIFALALLLSFVVSACRNDASTQAAEATETISNEISPSEPDPAVEPDLHMAEEPMTSAEEKMAQPKQPEPAAKHSTTSQRVEPRQPNGQPVSSTDPNLRSSLDAPGTSSNGGSQSANTKEIPNTAQPTDAHPLRPVPPPAPKETADPPSHAPWDALLRQYVTADGKVDYPGLKSDRAKLESYLQTLLANPPQDSWSRNEKLAYWINTYNAFTVKLIVDNYPTTSITKLEGGKPWDRKWIRIGGQTYSLNNIENDIIRPRFNEPRIHFAVNCAAKSCPPLLNRAWTAGNLESNFEKQTRAFINNPSFNVISEKKVQVSKIFDWYSADFGKLIDYLNKYSNTKINASAKVEFKEYDWDLNGK